MGEDQGRIVRGEAMSDTEEALLEALEETRGMARELATCAGFLLALAKENELLNEEGIAGGHQALLGWHRFDLRVTELLARVTG